ncbi:MAG: hypothetical protein N3A56_03925 [Thermodesulfobacteriaceae bacterium]|nr:hypothetical protein [Thermodesulfobacteriaceae bacterium]
MKMPKSIIYKPSIGPNYSSMERDFSSESSISSLKEFLKECLLKSLIFILIFLNLLSWIAFGYQGYLFIKYKIERKTLERENKALREEYKKLTSQEVLLEKAKNLGLRAPQKEDYWKLEK